MRSSAKFGINNFIAVAFNPCVSCCRKDTVQRRALSTNFEQFCNVWAYYDPTVVQGSWADP